MTDSKTGGQRTPLYDTHISLGARMVDFAGWEMPVQYSGIKDEHLAVRNAAGLFDICHMGEVEISGPDALALLQYLTPNDAANVRIGAAQYTALLNERAGVIDDLIFYRMANDFYYLIVNASTRAKDVAWINKHAGKYNVKVEDKSDTTALLALQGPKSLQLLAALTETNLHHLDRFHFVLAKVAGCDAMINRTGYTGEDGFEISLDSAKVKGLWDKIIEEGKDLGLKPCGLGARDTLRLEMGYSLYGNDADEDHTPYESNIGWICKPEKGDFIGSEILKKQKEEGPKEKLIGLTFTSKGVPRHGYDVADAQTKEKIGVVTSGTMSPMMGIGIALARVKAAYTKEGTKLGVIIRDKFHEARVTRPPFYKKA